MEHNPPRLILTEIIAAFIAQKGLKFTVSGNEDNFNRKVGVIYSASDLNSPRCRALIWEFEAHKQYTSHPAPCITIYNVDPEKSYTAIGDRRCDLSIADPNFFEQLEHHLLHDLI